MYSPIGADSQWALSLIPIKEVACQLEWQLWSPGSTQPHMRHRRWTPMCSVTFLCLGSSTANIQPDNLGITSIQQWDHPGCGTHLNPLDQYVLKGPISGCRPLQTHFDLCQTTPDWSQVYLINVIYSNLLCASHWGILWVIRAMAHCGHRIIPLISPPLLVSCHFQSSGFNFTSSREGDIYDLS